MQVFVCINLMLEQIKLFGLLVLLYDVIETHMNANRQLELFAYIFIILLM